jgi:hypothetical protein
MIRAVWQWLRDLLILVREFCWPMLEAGPPLDWDQQCRDAVADDEKLP